MTDAELDALTRGLMDYDAAMAGGRVAFTGEFRDQVHPVYRAFVERYLLPRLWELEIQG